VSVLAGRLVAVSGPGEGATEAEVTLARELGAALARAGAVVVTGGLAGVMAAAAEGVREAGGTSIGLLPGTDRAAGSPAHTVLLPTGLGELRNGLLVRAADAVVAIGGGWGTLSEVALAVRTGRPLVRLGGWELPEPAGIDAIDVADALAALEELLR
jgi:uncharacterized protein (TIGR00725 family)